MSTDELINELRDLADWIVDRHTYLYQMPYDNRYEIEKFERSLNLLCPIINLLRSLQDES